MGEGGARLEVNGTRVCRWDGYSGRAAGAVARAIVLEEPVPRWVDRVRVGEVLLVQLVHKPLVRPELCCR